MTTQKRTDLGFGDALDEFDPKDWNPSAKTVANRPSAEENHAAAAAAGFQSREAGQGRSQQRRRRTGRNAQLNLKTTPAAIEDFCAIADAMNWGLGETLEKAIPLLRREFLDN